MNLQQQMGVAPGVTRCVRVSGLRGFSLTYLREELRSRPEGWRAEERVNSVSEHLKLPQHQLKPATDGGASNPSPPGPNPAGFSILLGRKLSPRRTVGSQANVRPGWIRPVGTGFRHPYSKRAPRFHEYQLRRRSTQRLSKKGYRAGTIMLMLLANGLIGQGIDSKLA